MIQLCYVSDYVKLKTLSVLIIMTFETKEVPTNLVPAVAVIRGGLVLLGMIGRKGRVGCFLSTFLNTKAKL